MYNSPAIAAIVLLVQLFSRPLLVQSSATQSTRTSTMHEVIDSKSMALQQHQRYHYSQQQLHQHYDQSNRDMQFDFGGLADIFAIVETVCSAIGLLIPGATCGCSVLFSIDFVCEFDERRCKNDDFNGFCYTPSLIGAVTLIPNIAATLEFCLADVTSGGVAVESLCFRLGGSTDTALVREEDSEAMMAIGGDGFWSRVWDFGGNVWKAVRLLYAPPTESSGNLEVCSVSSESGEDCNFCEICDEGRGYIFDCSNIDPLWVQSECTEATIITNLQQIDEVQFLPNIDDPNVEPPTGEEGSAFFQTLFGHLIV